MIAWTEAKSIKVKILWAWIQYYVHFVENFGLLEFV